MYIDNEKKKAYHRNYYQKHKKPIETTYNSSGVYNPKLEFFNLENAIQRYESGDSMPQIAEFYGTSKTTIKRKFIKAGVKLRGREDYLQDGKNNKRYNGYEEITGTQWAMIRGAAKIRNLEFLITKKLVWELFLRQNKKCALSGLDLFFPNNVKEQNAGQWNASMDRIDSSKGYTEDNIQWVHKDINRMKWAMEENEFLYLCNKISLFDKRFIPMIKNELPDFTKMSKDEQIIEKYKIGWTKKELIKEYHTYYGYITSLLKKHNIINHFHDNRKNQIIPSGIITRIKSGARIRELEFSINASNILDLYLNQGGVCALSGLPIVFENQSGGYLASIDRIDSSIGYIIDNIQLVFRPINMMKNDYTQSYFINMCKIITNFQKEKYEL